MKKLLLLALLLFPSGALASTNNFSVDQLSITPSGTLSVEGNYLDLLDIFFYDIEYTLSIKSRRVSNRFYHSESGLVRDIQWDGYYQGQMVFDFVGLGFGRGSYTARFCFDTTNEVAETDEGDNCLTQILTY